MNETQQIAAGITVRGNGVAGGARLLAAAVSGRPPSFAHCRRLLDRFGMVQFACGASPDLDFGYCLDDNARAFLAALLGLRLDPQLGDARVVGEAALRFVEISARRDGRFHNLMAADGSFTDEVGSEESLARTIWACAVAARCAPLESWRDRALAALEPALDHLDELKTLRPRSYAILGLAAAVAPEQAALIPPLWGPLPDAQARKASQALERLCSALSAQFERHATAGWEWWEPALTWGNARAPEALLRGAAALGDSSLEGIGLRALTFLMAKTHAKDTFIPIGNHGWYKRGGPRAAYDQQPIEACCMVDAWLAAATSTGRLEYLSKALEAFGWFLGLNSERLALVEPHSGGCRDGLGCGELNMNMGAESTLSYVHAHAAIAAAFRKKAI